LLFFMPWTPWLFAALWHGWRGCTGKQPEALRSERDAYRFLLIWIVVYLAVFSLAATQLPHYVYPLYPALAMLTGRLFQRWLLNSSTLGRWYVAWACLLLAGFGMALTGLLALAGGALHSVALPAITFPELAPWSGLGLILTAAAVIALILQRHGRRLATL